MKFRVKEGESNVLGIIPIIEYRYNSVNTSSFELPAINLPDRSIKHCLLRIHVNHKTVSYRDSLFIIIWQFKFFASNDLLIMQRSKASIFPSLQS